MEEDIECLLEKLDKTPKYKLKGLEIKEELEDRKIPPHILDKLILECYNSGLIRPDNAVFGEANNLAYIDGIYYVLTSKGLEYLNQIRIKNDIECLDDSIRKFNESSDKSAKIMEIYTVRLVNLTWLLVILTILLLVIPPNISQSEKYIGIIFIVIFSIIIIPLKKNK